MEKEKLRSEIEDKYKWDLSLIYNNEDDWYKDLEITKEEIKKIENYKNKFLLSADNLLEYLEFDEKLDRVLNKLYYYAHLNFDSDTTNDKYKKMVNEITDIYVLYNEKTSFVLPSILNTDYKVFEKYFEDNKKLMNYKFEIDEIYRYKKHTLDEEKEKMLSALSKCMSNGEEVFETLTDTDLEFGQIKDEKGNLVEFNESNYSIFIRSSDRRVRRDCFNLLFNTYSKYKNTLASCFSNNIESNVVSSKIREYDSAIEASLFDDNVDISIYDNLIKTINDNLDKIYKYYDLKKNVLKIDDFHMYDVYAPLVKDYNKKYSFEEARDIVVNALSVLGDEYINDLKKAFDEKWIDVYHNKGKRGGAYSSGGYDTKPYLLLNYEGKLDDVSALIHELGHSMHTYYSCKNNSYTYHSYKIFVAEVASTVNELLLANYLLKTSKDKNEKLHILNHLLELYRTTIYRQVMFAEFERDMYEKREQGEILTASFLSDNYLKLVKKYFGNNVIIDEEIKYEWERVPHFYYNFYVYKYATGLAAASYIVTSILNNKPNAKEDYLKFLTLGGSMYPTDELKKTNVDMNDPKVIESAINMFNNYLDEFNKLYNE